MTLFTPRYLPWTLGLLLFLLAFALRAQDLDVFLTPDETRWACRSTNFWSALSEGRWSDSYQKEHPGVVTIAEESTSWPAASSCRAISREVTAPPE